MYTFDSVARRRVRTTDKAAACGAGVADSWGLRQWGDGGGPAPLTVVGLDPSWHPVASARATHKVMRPELPHAVSRVHLMHTSYAKDPDVWAL